MEDILKLLEELNHGTLARDGSQRLQELLKAVEETKDSGTLTIKLRVKANADDTAFVTGEIVVKKPNKKRPPILFFLHKSGLHKEDPRQMTLPDTAGSNVHSFVGRQG